MTAERDPAAPDAIAAESPASAATSVKTAPVEPVAADQSAAVASPAPAAAAPGATAVSAAPAAAAPATPKIAASKSASASATASAAGTTRPAGRRARLVLSRIDPWSVMKLAFILGIAAAVALIVAVVAIWGVLEIAGVFDAVNRSISDILRADTATEGADVSSYLSFPRWLGLATLTGVLNVILMTALATLSAFLYNIATSLVGGVQVTLSEDV